MRITCVADLHGLEPRLPGGDLLIVAGDLTARDSLKEHQHFFKWLIRQPYGKTIVIAGNHDGNLKKYLAMGETPTTTITYLEDSGVEIEGIKIWGSPYTPAFMDWHFMLTPDKDKTHWNSVPDEVDILITHGPAYSILDQNIDNVRCGSRGLLRTLERTQPFYHIFGHIHEGYGETERLFNQRLVRFINCAFVDHKYRNGGRKPITFDYLK